MSYLFFACGATMLLFVLAQPLSSEKRPANYYMALACLALGCDLMYFWAAEARFLERLPWLIGGDVSATILAAPGFYLASRSIMQGGARSPRPAIAYFAAPLAFVLAFAAYRILAGRPAARARDGIVGLFEYPLLFGAAMTAMSATIGYTLFTAYRLKRSGKARKGIALDTQVVFLHVFLLESFAALAACALMDDRLLSVSVAAFGLTAAGFTLTCTGVVFFSRKGPSFVSAKEAVLREWDDSSGLLSARVEKLMEESAPYLDPDLTLEKLSNMLQVDSKRLSNFFNAGLSTTFRSYINDRRLGAACRGLLETPDTTILEIAFASGFNSKTSFNTLFIKAYGMSPREYRSARGAAAREEGPRSAAGTPRRRGTWRR
jgi:AraC-like DNA-binding protein